jgi:peptide/nickel transport system permease protein
MTKFILRRLFLGIIIVFLGAMVVYGVIRLLPSSYVETVARQRASLPGGKSYTQWLAQLIAELAVDNIADPADETRKNVGIQVIYGV